MDERLNENIDRKLNQYFDSRAAEMKFSDDIFSHIEAQIKKDERRLRWGRIKRMKLVAAVSAICIITTLSCVAKTSTVHYYSYYNVVFAGHNNEEFTNSNNEDLTSDNSDDLKSSLSALNFKIKYTEKFKNGYVLNKAEIIETMGINELDYKCSDSRKLKLEYVNGNKKIEMTACSGDYQKSELSLVYNYSNYPYDKYNNIFVMTGDIQRKHVPNGYQLSEDDKKLLSQKMIEMSYGSNEVYVEHKYIAKWQENGVEYTIYNDDEDYNEMIEMGKEIIDSSYHAD